MKQAFPNSTDALVITWTISQHIGQVEFSVGDKRDNSLMEAVQILSLGFL
jgi:hypothetical protein